MWIRPTAAEINWMFHCQNSPSPRAVSLKKHKMLTDVVYYCYSICISEYSSECQLHNNTSVALQCISIYVDEAVVFSITVQQHTLHSSKNQQTLQIPMGNGWSGSTGDVLFPLSGREGYWEDQGSLSEKYMADSLMPPWEFWLFWLWGGLLGAWLGWSPPESKGGKNSDPGDVWVQWGGFFVSSQIPMQSCLQIWSVY